MDLPSTWSHLRLTPKPRSELTQYDAIVLDLGCRTGMA